MGMPANLASDFFTNSKMGVLCVNNMASVMSPTTSIRACIEWPQARSDWEGEGRAAPMEGRGFLDSRISTWLQVLEIDSAIVSGFN